MLEKAAVYAITTARDAAGRRITFRVGQPVDWNTAQARWTRLDDVRRAGRAIRIGWMRRRYKVAFLEVRTVDYHGRGLGSERHRDAFTVPYRAVRYGR